VATPTLTPGNLKSGQNYATLMTRVSTCELTGVNPEEY
jgi:hypothetical protein